MNKESIVVHLFASACRKLAKVIPFPARPLAPGDAGARMPVRYRGYLGATAETSAQWSSERAMKEAEALLKVAAAVGRLGAWSVRIEGMELTLSQEVCAIHEVPDGFEPTLARVLRFYRGASARRLREMLHACARDGTPFEAELPITTALGNQRWVRASGLADRDAEGHVVFVQGAIQDITRLQRDADEARRAAERLLHSQLEIERLNEGLEERVRQRTAQLRAANRDMEAFSYSIAHDLRAPLSALAGYSQALEECEQSLSVRGRHFLRRIKANARQMDEMTEGLLVLANVSRAELTAERVDLAQVCRDVLRSLQEQQPERAVRVVIGSGLRATGDTVLLQRVMANLLGNAWKFTGKREGAVIEVGSEAGSSGQTIYHVKDNGAGFDMSYSKQLFGAFQRLHKRSEFEGTGIGLATVHKIIHRHGGKIWAQAARGEGATFFFTLGA